MNSSVYFGVIFTIGLFVTTLQTRQVPRPPSHAVASTYKMYGVENKR